MVVVAALGVILVTSACLSIFPCGKFHTMICFFKFLLLICYFYLIRLLLLSPSLQHLTLLNLLFGNIAPGCNHSHSRPRMRQPLPTSPLLLSPEVAVPKHTAAITNHRVFVFEGLPLPRPRPQLPHVAYRRPVGLHHYRYSNPR